MWFTAKTLKSTDGFNLTVGDPPVISGNFSCPQGDASILKRCIFHDVVYGALWDNVTALVNAVSTPFMLYDNSAEVVAEGVLVKSPCELH